MVGKFLRNYTDFFLQIPDWNNAVIVAKNPLVAKRASSYAERLRVGIAFMHGKFLNAVSSAKLNFLFEFDSYFCFSNIAVNNCEPIGICLILLTGYQKPIPNLRSHFFCPNNFFHQQIQENSGLVLESSKKGTYYVLFFVKRFVSKVHVF